MHGRACTGQALRTELEWCERLAPGFIFVHPCSQQHSNSASERADCATPRASHVIMLQCSLASGIALLHAVDERIEV